MRTARYAYAALAWLFVIGVAVQAFLAGIGLFSGDPRDWGTHIQLGWTLAHLVPLVWLLVAFVARVGRRTLIQVAVVFGLSAVQPFLPGLRDTNALLAALHPLNALLMFGLGLRLALESRSFLSSGLEPPAAG